jgi:hypothetical protein
MKTGLASAVILILSGCGSSESPAEDELAAIAPDAPLKIVIPQFPASYFGRWGMTDADCILEASDAKGLITVQGSLVKFHDSTATMTKGLRETLYALSGDFDLVAKEQKWRTHNRYRLTEDRKQMIRQDGVGGEKSTYFRCPE